jgi:hypothetical protein
MSEILGFSTKALNRSLRSMRALIDTLPPGEGRDKMQRRFDRVVDRIAAVPARVMLQFDAGTIKSDGEFEAVYRMEMLLALDGFGET